MPYIIKTGKDIKTTDIDAFYPLIGFDVYTPQEWQKVIHASTFMIQVQLNNQTIGFGRTVDDGTFCMIYDVAVHPDFQKKGIGRIIMHQIKLYIRQNNIFSTSLFYNPNHKGIKTFYEKCGFYTIENAMRLKNDVL